MARGDVALRVRRGKTFRRQRRFQVKSLWIDSLIAFVLLVFVGYKNIQLPCSFPKFYDFSLSSDEVIFDGDKQVCEKIVLKKTHENHTILTILVWTQSIFFFFFKSSLRKLLPFLSKQRLFA